MSVVEPETTVNTHAVKTHLSRLVERAEQGEDTAIARNGKPVTQLVPYRGERGRRIPGYWRSRVERRPGVDESDQQIARPFGTVD